MSAEGEFDPIIHAPNRLQICAMLMVADNAEFGAVRDTLGVSDSVLSKHVRQLEEAGYVALSKAVVQTRQRTWLRLTKAGRKAFEAHVAALERLVAQAKAAGGASSGAEEPAWSSDAPAEQRAKA